MASMAALKNLPGPRHAVPRCTFRAPWDGRSRRFGAEHTNTQAHAHTHALRIRGPAHHAHLALPFGEGRIVFFAVTAPFACVLSTFKPLEEQQQSQSNV